ncbi:uncharacterized protein [Periplaneta americana]|uniref:Ig-like domain-containing protein n=1 Tax=Periplaneta americana TaxID=6978 RepID=A0ABQ8TX16_PERAM|nr:hypothetical protein ANN_02310 [Periplaneta americana]
MGIAAAVVLSLWAAVIDSVVGQVIVQEVNVGGTATLPCLSNDDSHRFQFWQLQGDKVVGPGNAVNREKYRYEVLTGTLYIKSVSTSEAGFYKCVSKGLTDPSFNVQAVELIVKKDWEEVWETDPETNVLRVAVAVVTLIVLIGLAFLAYRLIKRRRTSRFRDMSDEESPDETVPHGGSYNVSNLPPMTPTHASPSQGLDNPALDTDFPKEFQGIGATSDSRM